MAPREQLRNPDLLVTDGHRSWRFAVRSLRAPPRLWLPPVFLEHLHAEPGTLTLDCPDLADLLHLLERFRAGVEAAIEEAADNFPRAPQAQAALALLADLLRERALLPPPLAVARPPSPPPA